jgi:hypothetical protein
VQNTQPSEILTSVQAFDFDIVEQQYQATSLVTENISKNTQVNLEDYIFATC